MRAARIALPCILGAMIGIAASAAPVQRAPAARSAATESKIYTDVYNGWKWWHVYCFRCHGTNGIATSVAPSLIDPNRRMPLATFVTTARNGRPNQGMQSWRKLLDDKQLAQIYTYVRARSDKVLPPGRPHEVGPKGGVWAPPPGRLPK